jgi:phage portal protein BeeE
MDPEDIIGSVAVMTQTWGSSGAMTERLAPLFFDWVTKGYQSNGVVFAVLNARMNLFTEARLCWRDRVTKEISYSPDGSLGIFEQPWENGTTGDMLATMEQLSSLAGNSYAVIDSGPGFMHFLRPDWVDLVVELSNYGGHTYRTVIGCLYHPNGLMDEESEYYDYSEVAHYKPIPDPLRPHIGMSWLTPVIREINGDIAMVDHKIRFFDNAATPNMVVKYKEKLNDQTLARVQAAIHARHGGVENAYKTMVLDMGADLTVVGLDFEKIGFETLQAAGESRIASAAGVPSIMAGLGGTASSQRAIPYNEAQQHMANSLMRPLWRNACSTMQKLAGTVPSGKHLWYDVSDIAALAQGEKEKAETFQAKSATTNTLINAGYVPDSVAMAVDAADLTMLKHTGLVPVQLYKPEAGQPRVTEAEKVQLGEPTTTGEDGKGGIAPVSPVKPPTVNAGQDGSKKNQKPVAPSPSGSK